MKIVLAAALLLAVSAAAWANNCTMHTVISGGRMVNCTTCCFVNGNCTTTCF
jgi:hypothetical protein